MNPSPITSRARPFALLLALVTAACGIDDTVGIDDEGTALSEDTGTTVTILLPAAGSS